MSAQAAERRLAAIMFTDIVDYTALMAESEEKGLAARERHRAVVRPLVEKYHGESIEARGDESLSTFPTALDAVNCALAIGESLVDDDELKLHIGIHLGDFVVRSDEISGDGVNIAARICALSKGDAPYISDEVQHSVHNQPNLSFEALGDQELKNVPRPVRIYRVSGTAQPPRRIGRTSPARPLGALVAAGLFLSAGAYISYQVFTGRLSEISVAILPLKTNATVPAAQPYGFGIADSLRSSLQQIPVFRVPARTSSEAVVQAGLDIPGIASKLDVHYIVEGTLEMVGQRLNISLSLIDEGGDVQWSELFERNAREIFDLQNDLVRALALELGLDESDADLQRTIRKPAPTQDMEAHRLFLQGKYVVIEPGASLLDSDGMKALKAARQRDPGYAAVYPAIAFIYAFDCWILRDRRSPSCELAVNYATQGLQIDPDQADALTTLALVHSLRYEYPEAQAAIDRFLVLADQSLESSSLPWAYLHLGRLQLAWDSAREYYRNDPLSIFAVGNLVLWASVLKKDDVVAEHYENILMEMMGLSILQGYPATRVHRVDLHTAIQDAREMLPVWGISPDIADIWVRPLYDPSLRQSALEKLEALYEQGDIRPATYWKTLIVLHQTDRAVNMAFDQYDQGVLEPVELWLDLPGGKEFRSHPRFMELVEYIGLASYWDDVGWPAFCELRGNEHFCGLDFEVQ